MQETLWKSNIFRVSIGLKLHSALQADVELVIWSISWPIAEGGRNPFKATICLKRQIISSLSQYESVITSTVNRHQPIGQAESKPISVTQAFPDKYMITWQRQIYLQSHSYTTYKTLTKALSSVVLTPTYRLASSRHPDSFVKGGERKRKFRQN